MPYNWLEALLHKWNRLIRHGLAGKATVPLTGGFFFFPFQARGEIAVAQAEAARIEQRSRDALYHAAYAEE